MRVLSRRANIAILYGRRAGIGDARAGVEPHEEQVVHHRGIEPRQPRPLGLIPDRNDTGQQRVDDIDPEPTVADILELQQRQEVADVLDTARCPRCRAPLIPRMSCRGPYFFCPLVSGLNLPRLPMNLNL